MAKQFYNYENEADTKVRAPRVHFRNILQVAPLLKFPFEPKELNPLYDDYYDIYFDPETDSYIWVIGGDAHCHVREELGKYEEGIVLYCDPEHKEDLIKKVSEIV